MIRPASSEEDIVAFFRGLSEAARREYEKLAEDDKRFGEDVASEERERARGASS
jgi:hypothetical protein